MTEQNFFKTAFIKDKILLELELRLANISAHVFSTPNGWVNGEDTQEAIRLKQKISKRRQEIILEILTLIAQVA
jgi:hypothetical protein